MRCTLHLDGLQPLKASDAMIDVNHKIARRQGRKLADEVGRLLVAPSAANHSVTENVLLGDDDKIVGLETLLEPQHNQPGNGLVPGQKFRPILGGGKRRHVMVLENRLHALTRTFCPRGDGDAASTTPDVVSMGLHGLVDVAARLRAFRRETATTAAAEGNRVGALEG